MGSKTIHLVSLDATDAAVIAECQRRAWPTERHIFNQNLFFRVSLVVLMMGMLAFVDLMDSDDSSFVPVLVFILIAQSQMFDSYFRNRRELALTQELVCKGVAICPGVPGSAGVLTRIDRRKRPHSLAK